MSRNDGYSSKMEKLLDIKEKNKPSEPTDVYKMLYKMSLTVNEIPPLFCELDELSHSHVTNEYECWKEKARWIRFEEQAEDVLGRWSKPHVATLPHTSIEELKDLLKNGVVMLDLLLTDMRDIADAMANELIGYFSDLNHAKQFAEVMCLPHFHHHEKKYKRTQSGNNLIKLASSGNFGDLVNRKPENELSTAMGSNSGSKLKYQYSFTDSILYDDTAATADFKENTKFKKKVNTKAEGASVMVAPLDFVKEPKLVFLRLEAATELPGVLEVRLKSRFVVVIIGPLDRHIQLYEIGRAMATCLADDICKEIVYSAQCKNDIVNAVHQFNRSTMVIPASEWDPKIRIEPPEKFLSKEERNKTEISEYMHDEESEMLAHSHADPTLKGSKRPFAGLFSDIKRKMPFYSSDFTDCLNLQCIAATLYIYFVALCSVVAFGGLIGEKTEYNMGTMECIIAGALGGILFAMFSGQPLNILSATGPMLILEQIIFGICKQQGYDFMVWRLWIGLWTALFLFIFVMFNLSFLVKYITRFTEDCFASLVAIMFIIDAIQNTFKIGKKINKDEAKLEFKCNCFEKNSTLINDNDTLNAIATKYNLSEGFNNCLSQNKVFSCAKIGLTPDIYYFSLILFLLTFIVCMMLKNFRDKSYLPTKIRQIVSDFSVLIAILCLSGFDAYVGLSTPKLSVPEKFEPTKTGRSWLVPFNSEKNPWWLIPLAIIPGLISTILVFMDQQITAVIVNRKEFKLTKGCGYHLDLLVVAILIALCSLFGLPWFVAATVLALTHVNALKVLSENTAPGERPAFLGVREQRVSTLLMSLLTGLSVFFTSVLKFIPMPVLYGVFLFMGVSALNGIQFVERILILFMPQKYQPDYPYLRHVSTSRVHLFTFIQILSIAGLFTVKSLGNIGILFPIMVLATCGIRRILDHVFNQRELLWLDDILPGQHVKTVAQEEKEASALKDNSSTDHFFKNYLYNKFDGKNKVPNGNNGHNNMENEAMLKSNIHNLTSSTNSNSIDENSYDDNNNLNNSTEKLKANKANGVTTVNETTESPSTLAQRPHASSNPVKFVTHFADIQEDEV